MTIKLSPATTAVARFAAQCSNHSAEAESAESNTLVHRLQDEVAALECYHAAFRADAEAQIAGLPLQQPNTQEFHYRRAEVLVKSMLQCAWELNDLAKMSVDDYQDYFNHFMYADGEE